MDDHKGHYTVSVSAEEKGKQNQIEEMQRITKQKIQEKQQKLEELKQAVDKLKHSAQTAVEDTENVFTELILFIKKKHHEVTKLIRDQEKAELSRIEEVQEKLQQDIADLRSRDTKLKQLSNTEDRFRSKCFQFITSESEDLTTLTFCQQLSINERVKKSLSELKQTMEQVLQEEIDKIIPDVQRIQILPVTRKDFKQYFCIFTLDPCTVAEHLCLSENNRELRYPEHSGRYKFPCKVFCKESVTGRCYWEVEWSGSVNISVSYKETSSKWKGLVGVFGNNNTSWSLQCSPKPVFWHKSIKTKISGSLSSRIGVYVDHKAGTLSFYNISDTMTLLHSVQTTFTEPLYPGFWFTALGSACGLNTVCSGFRSSLFSSVKLCDA